MSRHPLKYAVKAHSMFRGEVTDDRWFVAIFGDPRDTRAGWVTDLGDATLWDDFSDAYAVSRKLLPCAKVVEVYLSEAGA